MSLAKQVAQRAALVEQFERLSPDPGSTQNVRALLCELAAYEMELEIQNHDLRQTQHVLEESRAALADMFYGAPIAYLTCTRSGLIKNANASAATLLNADREHLIGLPLASCLAPKWSRHLQEHFRRVADGVVVDELVTNAHAKGRVLQLHSVQAIDAGEDVIRSVAVDVTALRAAEARLRWLFQAGEILSKPLETSAVFQAVARHAVPAIADAISFAVRDSERGDWSVDAAVDEDSRAALRSDGHAGSRLQLALLLGNAAVGEMTVVMTHSGRHFAPTEFELLRDLAARASAALENHRRFDRAHGSAGMRLSRLSAIAHELKNPLGSATLSLDMLRRKVADVAEAQPYLDVAFRAVARMGRVVSDLLDFVQIDANALQIHRTAAQPSALVAALVQEYATDARRHGKEVVAEIRDTPVILCDPERLRRVLDKLIEVTLSLLPARGVLVVECRGSQAAIVIQLSERGARIPAASLSPLVESLSTTQAQTASGFAGLGLHLCRAIIEAHGGSFAARSHDGDECLFAITLPVVQS
jgi:K+-sensing histidine kinase KdpD